MAAGDSTTQTPAAKKYRFVRADFQPLETKPLHFDMVFDITETKVRFVLMCVCVVVIRMSMA